jgi:probable F420-dependent oxidoreductase
MRWNYRSELEKAMKFGAHLPSYWNDYGSSTVQHAVVEAAKAAESLGYDSVWANDKVISTPYTQAEQGMVGNKVEPFITHAPLVHLVPRVKLGTSVLVLPQRNPILVAKQAATLDLLSAGRLILGVGVGLNKSEFSLMGANFANRAAVNDEAIEVMQALWREPVAAYEGQFHHFEDAVMLPKPACPGGPPIWIGDGSPAALRRVARYGKAWIPYINDLESFQTGVAKLRELTREGTCPMIGGYFNLRIERPDKPADVQSVFPYAPISIWGSPDAIAEGFAQYQQSGLEYAIYLFDSEDVDDYLRQIQVFAEDIAPQFDRPE